MFQKERGWEWEPGPTLHRGDPVGSRSVALEVAGPPGWCGGPDPGRAKGPLGLSPTEKDCLAATSPSCLLGALKEVLEPNFKFF